MDDSVLNLVSKVKSIGICPITKVISTEYYNGDFCVVMCRDDDSVGSGGG